MRNVIHHNAVVTAVEGSCVTVRVEQSSACASCAAARMCQSSERREHLLRVEHRGAEALHVDDCVRLVSVSGAEWRSVVLAYVLPLVLVVGVLSAGVGLGIGEGRAALAAMASLVPYYIVLRVTRARHGLSLRLERVGDE